MHIEFFAHSEHTMREVLPAEYVTAFSEQTDAPKVRCDLTDCETDTQTDKPLTLAAHARRGFYLPQSYWLECEINTAAGVHA